MGSWQHLTRIQIFVLCTMVGSGTSLDLSAMLTFGKVSLVTVTYIALYTAHHH
jgi:hypothetical protein